MSEYDALPPPDISSPPEEGIRGRWPRPVVRLTGYALGVVLTVGLAALVIWLSAAVKGNLSAAVATGGPINATQPLPSQWQRPVVSDAGLADRSGVRITQLAVSGGGGLIDLRFQVLNPDKAATLHDAATPPILVDDASGVVVDNLLMGHSHSKPFQAGITYYLIFENPGNLVQTGSKVSVLLGNAEVDHVEVK